MKKLIALVIVAVMLLSMMPMMALAADGYVVAGGVKNSNTDAGFFGTRWNSSDQNNRMSQNADGSYYKKYTNVPAGNYEFKITNGSDWHGPDGNNYQLELIESSNDVVITFGKGNYSVCAIHPGKTFYVAGAEGLTGSNWSNGINEMSLVGDGIYEKTFENINKAGTYEFKVTDGSWTNAWGNNGNNYSVTVAAGENVTILFDSNRGYVTLQHTVTFSAGEGSVTPASAKTDANGKIALPIPTRDGYKFLGWAKTENGTTYVTADEVYTADATLYAQWTLDTDGIHTIAFYNGETAVGTMTTAKTTGTKGSLEGQQLLTVTAPANYTFGGWYKDLNDENSKVTTNTEFTAPTNVYAKWVKKPTLTLSFNLNGGEGNAPANASSVDGVVTLPAAPTRNGYTFNGWYDAATGGNLVIAADATTYTFTGEADASKTLYAQWTQNQAPTGPSLSVVGVLPGLSEWTPTDPNAVMTPKEGDIYEYLFENVAANTAMTLKITTSAGWNDAWNFGGDGNTALTIGTAYSLTCNGGSADLTFTIDTACDVKVTLNLSNFDETTKTGATLLVEKVVEGGNEGGGEGGSVTPPPATEDTYIVAGTANLCGTEWDPSNAANKLTKQSNGTYTITYNNVEADNYALKVTNGTWDKAWPTENYAFGVTEKCNVTVTFNPETKEVKVTGDHVGEPVSTGVYIVAGSAGLCGEAWNTTLVANKMTKQSDGTYTITYTDVAAGDYEFKVTDGTWNNAWPNQNYALSVAAKSTVTITFNADAETVTVSVVPVEGEGGEQGGSTGGEQGGTEGGNQSGTTGNPEVPTGSLIIHAKVPAAWASAYLYAWNTGDDVMASWPGTAMTKGDDGWYTIEIPAGYKNIIVAEKNGGEQTVDLSIANVTGNEIWVTLGEKNAEGKYPATIAEDEKGEDVVAPPEVKEVVVYAQVPADWSAPYVYAWNGSANNASWPGVAMTKGENGWWYAKVPASVENVIISNKGTPQTVDLKLEKLSVDVWVKVAAAGADGKYNATTQYSSPATGDTAIIAPVVFLMVMSVTGLAVLTVGKKKYF